MRDVRMVWSVGRSFVRSLARVLVAAMWSVTELRPADRAVPHSYRAIGFIYVPSVRLCHPPCHDVTAVRWDVIVLVLGVLMNVDCCNSFKEKPFVNKRQQEKVARVVGG